MLRSILLLILLAACAHTKESEKADRCPESRELSCMTKVECSYDRDRKCKVCRCSNPWESNSEGRLPSDLPPDSNALPLR